MVRGQGAGGRGTMGPVPSRGPGQRQHRPAFEDRKTKDRSTSAAPNSRNTVIKTVDKPPVLRFFAWFLALLMAAVGLAAVSAQTEPSGAGTESVKERGSVRADDAAERR